MDLRFTPADLAVLVADGLLAPLAVYALKVARAAREGIRWKLRVREDGGSRTAGV